MARSAARIRIGGVVWAGRSCVWEEKMKRWDYTASEDVEAPDVDAFLKDLIKVCRNHNMSITHENVHGDFINM